MPMNRQISNPQDVMKQSILTILLGVGLAQGAWGTSALYENHGTVLSPPDTAPQVDATNFLNTGDFSISFGIPQQFITANTRNYTNTGTMTADYGFDFETYPDIGDPFMASSFFNSGTINSGSGFGFGFSFFGGGLQTIISATNLDNPGDINMDNNSTLKMSGQNVDLTRGQFIMAIPDIFFGNDPAVFSVDYGVGQCPVTNGYSWNPQASLTAFFASSAIFTNHTGLQQGMFLTATPYFDVQQSGPSNLVIRGVFLQSANSNVTTKVFLNQNFGLGNGRGNIEWSGPYTDPQTGVTTINYFYLADVMDRTTNASGVPDGFTFGQSLGTSIFSGAPTTAGMYPLFLSGDTFPPGNVTNTYAYTSVQVLPTSVKPFSNTEVYLTNLAGRIEINAASNLDMTLAQVTGANYISLQSPVQFNGNLGALISAPFASINIGVTNGNLTASNLLTATLPAWNGTVQAWNTQWFVTNGAFTLDYRILLVNSDLFPSSAAQTVNLALHATTNLVISDAYNVINSFTTEAQRLTLTTNGYGNGAQSVDGELNLQSTTFSWAAATPNLRWLTNYGAIRIPNTVVQSFGNGSPGGNYHVLINNGVIVDGGATVWADTFDNGGIFTNGGGGFTLRSLNATVTNGTLTAGSDMSITSSTLITSNSVLQAGRSLTLRVTNLLTDLGAGNGNRWSVGTSNGAAANSLSLPIKPIAGDLLGTVITNTAPAATKKFPMFWAGEDRGVSVTGFTNNAAIGRLVLDALGPNSLFTFSGPGVTNALYVDRLELLNYATNHDGSYNFLGLSLTNVVIYYAQATINGVSVAQKMNHKNGDRLRWVAGYAGYFSSTNLVYGGSTNTVNAALAQDKIIDSDGDGTPNFYDATPFFLASQLNFSLTLTNTPAPAALLKWTTIPLATNYLYFKTNLSVPGWQLLTNFPSTPPLPYSSGPATVSVLELLTGVPHYYQVVVQPCLTCPPP